MFSILPGVHEVSFSHSHQSAPLQLSLSFSCRPAATALFVFYEGLLLFSLASLRASFAVICLAACPLIRIVKFVMVSDQAGDKIQGGIQYQHHPPDLLLDDSRGSLPSLETARVTKPYCHVNCALRTGVRRATFWLFPRWLQLVPSVHFSPLFLFGASLFKP